MSSSIGYALIEIKLVERAGMSAVELLNHGRIFNNCHNRAHNARSIWVLACAWSKPPPPVNFIDRASDPLLGPSNLYFQDDPGRRCCG
jgi:hypothetical protein